MLRIRCNNYYYTIDKYSLIAVIKSFSYGFIQQGGLLERINFFILFLN